MFIKELDKENIDEIINLDKEVNGISKFSKEEILDIMEYDVHSGSYGVFKEGNLIAFLIGKKEGRLDYVFSIDYRGLEILHAASKSKRALMILFLTAPAYLKNSTYSINYIKVKVNQQGLNFCKKAAEKLTPVVEEIVINRYEKGIYDLVLKIGEVEPKHLFYQLLYKTFGNIDKNCVDYKEIFYHILPYINYGEKLYSLEEIINYKKTMIRFVTQRNLEFLNMLGSEYRVMLEFREAIYGEKQENYFKSIEKLGYTEQKGHRIGMSNHKYDDAIKDFNNKYYWVYANVERNQKMVNRYKFITLDSKYYNGTLSYYRHILKKHLSDFYEKSTNYGTSFHMYDKYGCKLIEFSTLSNVYNIIPMFNSVKFDHYINKMILENKIYKECADVYGLTLNVINGSDYLFTASRRIKKLAGEEEIFKYLDRVCKVIEKNKYEQIKSNIEYRPNYIESSILHDWYYPITSIFDFETRVFLTKGAYKKILTFPLNKIVQLDNKLKQITKLSKKINVKEIRKQLSKCIRNNGNYDEIFENINLDIKKKWLRNNKIDDEMKYILDDFIKRINKYANSVTAVNFFRMFGKKRALSILNGNYEGLFEEKDFMLSKEKIGLFIKDCLGKRGLNSLVKNPFKLYNKLNKIYDVDDMIAGNIPEKKEREVLKTIKQQYNKIPQELYLINKFRGKIEKKCSPEFLIAGDASVCCMSFGANNARTYAREKGFGVYNIYYGNRIIANSVLWINDAYNCLVIDNIEVHPNYEKYNNYITELYSKMINYTMEQYKLDFAVQGSSYNDLELWGEDDYCFSFAEFKAREVKDRFYTDASYSHTVQFRENKDKVINFIENKGTQANCNDTIDDDYEYDLVGLVG